jgi:hypothetical protein
MVRWGIHRRRTVDSRGDRGMVIPVQLGMREALTIVWLLLLLGVRREHALRVGLLVRLLRPLIVRVLLARGIGWRRPGANASQQGLEIVRGGHFCRAPWVTGDLRTKAKLCKLSSSSLSRGR